MAYVRKTTDEFEIQGFYCGSWEMVTSETTRSEAKKRLKEYRTNEPKTSFRSVHKLVKIV
jgi:hypothetical protein